MDTSKSLLGGDASVVWLGESQHGEDGPWKPLMFWPIKLTEAEAADYMRDTPPWRDDDGLLVSCRVVPYVRQEKAICQEGGQQ